MTESQRVVGVFIGLEAASYEYIANIIAPYQLDFSLELGSFLLIEGMGESLVSRVMQYVPRGEFTSAMGEKWLSDVAFEADAIGADIKKRKISYRVRIKILGTIQKDGDFKPGLVRIPHITSQVFKPTKDQVRKIVNKALIEQETGVSIGHYSLNDEIDIKFDLKELNARRTFIFARAGYGKSNLMKLLASDWSSEYGGLCIFDPEGEYAITDAKGRPGIMDKREAILVTNRYVDTDIKNVYNKLKINFKDFRPQSLLPRIVTESKHSNIFFMKLMGLRHENWCELVDLLREDGFRADETVMNELLELDNDSSIGPIKNNLVPAIRDLHDPDSKLVDIVLESLKQGQVIIIDISLMDSTSALRLSSIIVNHIFKINQRHFTSSKGETLINATFLVEEAQSVLSTSDLNSFVELAKEGRKYHLGGIFVTQQPSSIPFEILSQGDNFFVFHLLSRGDLQSLQRANAHYSGDIVTQILNEPIKGKCYMWTSDQPFVIPVSVKNYENIAKPNLAVAQQNSSEILKNIIISITEELSNPLLNSILSKMQDVEIRCENGDFVPDKKTIELYKVLEEAEKEYLRGEEGIQTNKFSTEFAVKTVYYIKLRQLLHSLR